MTESPYLLAHEAVVYLRCQSRSALQRLIKEHRLPHGRSGRKLLFDKRELDAWVKGFGSALELVRRQKKAS